MCSINDMIGMVEGGGGRGTVMWRWGWYVVEACMGGVYVL